MKRRLLLTVLFVLMFLFPGVVAAQTAGDADEGFIFRANGDVTVATGDELGGVIVANGNAIVDGTVTDTLWVISGDATVTGEVGGDVVVIDGTLHLASGATVDNVTLIRGTLDRAADATITGDLTEQDNLVGFGWAGAVFSAAMWLGVTIVLILAGLLYAYAGGRQLSGTGELMRERWGASIVTGLALFVGLPILAVMAFFTIIGIPLGVAILLVVMPALWVLGYLVAGTWLGRMLTRAMGRTDRPERPLLAAALGILVFQLVGLVPALGPMLTILAGVIGAGALVYRIVGRPRASVERAVAVGSPSLTQG
jgi:hypothetical protein